MSTIHANSASEGLTRVAHLVVESGHRLDVAHVQSVLAMDIQIVVHITRADSTSPDEGKRRIEEVLGVQLDPINNLPQLEWRYVQPSDTGDVYDSRTTARRP
jgi:Flp pilus assembly CpaF family ATPase